MTPANFPFAQEVKSYNSGEVITPFQQQGQMHDRVLGEIVHRAYIWRLWFKIVTGVSIFLLLVFILLLNSSPFTTYVLSVTKTGFLKQVNLLENSYQIPDTSYEKFLKDVFLGALTRRGLPTYQWYQNFVSVEAQKQIIENFQIFKPKPLSFALKKFDMRENGQFEGVLVYDNEEGYERRFEINGLIRHATPQVHDLVMLNPLGFYLDKINVVPILLDNRFKKRLVHE